MTLFQIAALVLIIVNLFIIYHGIEKNINHLYVNLIWTVSMVLLGTHCFLNGPQVLAYLFFACAILEVLSEVFADDGDDEDDAGPCC